VLVVDDEPAIRLLCRVNLELEGFRVLEAGTLGAARATLDDHDVDVVVLDLHVGAEDGFSLADELRDRDEGVKVALLTGSVEASRTDAARVDAVVRKPFALDTLVGAVRGLAAIRCAAR
jgi:DNA-binding response OmpR family regulator